MSDTVLRLDYGGPTPDHPESAALGTYGRTALAAYAIADVNVRMLATWTFRKQLALSRGITRPLVPLHLPSEIEGQRHKKDESINSKKEPVFRQGTSRIQRNPTESCTQICTSTKM